MVGLTLIHPFIHHPHTAGYNSLISSPCTGCGFRNAHLSICHRRLSLVDEVSFLIHISSYLPPFPSAHRLTRGQSSCLRPVPYPCNDSITSTSLHPAFTTNSAVLSVGRIMSNACRTFNPMMPHGLLTIWTRCVAKLSLPALCSTRRRSSIFSILPVLLPGGVYTSSEVYAGPTPSSQRRTHFRLTISKSIPNLLPPVVMLMCTGGPSMVQGFASSAYGCLPRTTPRRSLKFVVRHGSFSGFHH